MPRAKLTDEERDARRRARAAHSFSDAAYEHYDPLREGYGSRADWAVAAEALAAGRGIYKGPDRKRRNPDLEVLELDEMPADIDGLKTAFRTLAMRTHPDHRPDLGGDTAAFRTVYAAFERLVKFY
jgi:hypothetical protein